MLLEVAARPDLLDWWEREFVLGLSEQQGIESDQRAILNELVIRLRAEQQQAA